jgi:putative hydrolase of the HAD superfamily
VFERVRLITFDLDDTLWPTTPVIMAAEQRLHDWLGQHAPRIAHSLSIHSMRKQRLEWMQEHPGLAHDLTLVRLKTLENLLREFGYSLSLAEQGLAVFREARNQVIPWDDVLPVLGYLRQHYMLVSLTNGNAQIEHTPLQNYFHLSLSAEGAGAAKPDPAMFHEVSKWAGLSFEQMLHVGDDWERDVLPATRLGMATAWVHRQGLKARNTKQADLCLFNLYPLRVYLS